MAKSNKAAAEQTVAVDAATVAAVTGEPVTAIEPAAPVAPVIVSASERQLEKMKEWEEKHKEADAKAKNAEKAFRESLKGIKRRAIDSTVGVAAFGFIREASKQEKHKNESDRFGAAVKAIGCEDPRSKILSLAGEECEALAKALLGGE